jgi:hypothetical protein
MKLLIETKSIPIEFLIADISDDIYKSRLIFIDDIIDISTMNYLMIEGNNGNLFILKDFKIIEKKFISGRYDTFTLNLNKPLNLIEFRKWKISNLIKNY